MINSAKSTPIPLRQTLERLGRVACLALLLGGFGSGAHAALEVDNELGCGPKQLGDFGPFDYRTASEHWKHRVEPFHFTPAVEFLSKSLQQSQIGSDLDFTLRYFPNHHRALSTLVEFAVRQKRETPIGMRFSMECWFIRAKTMAPDDAMVPTIYASYLLKTKRPKEALKELDAAQALGEDDVNVYYNIGLANIELGRYQEAREYAKKAYALGHPLPGLRNKLIRLNQWQD